MCQSEQQSDAIMDERASKKARFAASDVERIRRSSNKEVTSTSGRGMSAFGESTRQRLLSLHAMTQRAQVTGMDRSLISKSLQRNLDTSYVSTLREQTVSRSIVSQFDKAFTSVWLDDSHVAVGTKCNSLLCVSVDDQVVTRIPLPDEPVRPADDWEDAVNPFGKCGMHSVSLSPSGRLLATGGSHPSDVSIIRVPDASMDKSNASRYEHVQSFVGHRDWIFGLAWVSDRHVVSASRDKTIRLWSVSPEEGPTLYAPSALSTEHVNKVRDVRYHAPTRTLVTLGSEGVVKCWDAELLRSQASIPIPEACTRELVCAAVGQHLVATGSQSHVTLLDPRAGKVVTCLDSMDTNHGVRSLTFRDHLLSSGSGRGRISFLDLRFMRYLEHEREMMPADAELYHAGWRGTHRVPYLQTGEGHLAVNSCYQLHFQGMHVFNACYAHCWSPNGRRLFTAGGPLAFGLKGCYMATWS